LDVRRRREVPVAVIVSDYGSTIASNAAHRRPLVAIAVMLVAGLVARRFFFGKFLRPGDFSDEQQYRRCRRRLR
jgi:pimeloyl-ACP methyl ester carboxylesterase